MTVKDLIGEAGGPVPLKAYLKNAEISRLQVSDGAVRAVSSRRGPRAGPQGQLRAQPRPRPYDELIVRPIPDWMEEADRYVTLKERSGPRHVPIYKVNG